MNNFIKRFVSSFLITSICTLIFSASLVNAESSSEKNKDNKVIAYMYGKAITENDVDDNGIIRKDFSGVQSDKRVSLSTVTLPPGYDEAIIVKELHAPQFFQTTTDMYLTVENARDLASELDVPPGANIAAFILGLFPYMQIPTGITLINFLYRSELASDIRSYTDNDECIRFRVIDSRYATLYRVDYWDGETLDFSVTYDPPTVVETIVDVEYR